MCRVFRINVIFNAISDIEWDDLLLKESINIHFKCQIFTPKQILEVLQNKSRKTFKSDKNWLSI